jgi:hypothetical protein
MKKYLFFSFLFAVLFVLQGVAQRTDINAPEAKNRTPWYTAKPAPTIGVAKRRKLHGHVAKNTSPWDQLKALRPMIFPKRRLAAGALPKGHHPLQSNSDKNTHSDIAVSNTKQSTTQALLSFYGYIYQTDFGRVFERVETILYPRYPGLDKQR